MADPSLEPPQVIAIDGPAASGKSSVARMVADRLGWIYVNTGNMYRAVTWAVLNAGIDPADADAVAAVLKTLKLEFPLLDDQGGVRVAGTDPGEALNADSVNRAVSYVARVPEVRSLLVAAQRSLTASGPLVMEGRDIGTVVFPDASFKFYIDASEEVRQQRRRAQGQTDQVAERDRLDSSRTTSPLTIAPDAHVIDSSEMNLDQVVEAVLHVIRSRGLQPSGAW